MRKRFFILTVCFILLSFLILPKASVKIGTQANSDFRVHNIDTSLNYTNIQEAIDSPDTLDGHTILADAGVYYEHVVIHKSLTLVGENKTTTVIDGNGTGTVVKIDASNATVSEFTIQCGYLGIDVYSYMPQQIFNNSICDNIIMNNSLGLSIHVDDNKIARNVVKHNELGVCIARCNNTITNNIINNNVFGMYLDSSNNMFRDNEMVENSYNFISALFPSASAPYDDIDTSNTVNGKPIYYLVNQTDMLINPSTFPHVGYLALINCFNVTVRDLTLTNNGEGIVLSQCTNCTIEGNTIKNNLVAIPANTDNTSFSNNSIFGNAHGIALVGEYNQILNNTIANNTVRLLPYRWPEAWPHNNPILIWITQYGLMWYSGGLYLWHTFNSTIINNNITDNEHGILLYGSGSNAFKNNNIVGNVYNFGVDPSHLFPPEWVINPPEPPQISPYLINDVDTSNTVNGKPIYWWVNRHNEQVPTDAGYVVLVNSTNMIVNNLVLQNNTQGMLLVDVNNTVISNNIITDTRYGILIRPTMYPYIASNNTITHNNATKNGVGIYSATANSTFSYNLLAHNLAGIYDRGEGFNLIIGNTVANNTVPPLEEFILGYEPPYSVPEIVYYYAGAHGILLASANNTICYNNIQNNDYGLSTDIVTKRGKDNYFHHNNFINNTMQALIVSVNKWDSGYPSGGNYWSDYNGTDNNWGHYQNQIGSDGIGDESYNLSRWILDQWLTPEERELLRNQNDSFPLMAPISIFNVGTWNNKSYDVHISSNSTISDFQLNITQKTISFNVTGKDGEGFCRVTVPTIIVQEMWQEDYTVLVDGETVEFRNWTDGTDTYIYFTYQHTERRVIIVPEFPTAALIPMLTALTIIIAIGNRGSKKKLNDVRKL